MAKRVESFQADCLDGGSTPPSSTREKDQQKLVFFSCGAYAPTLNFTNVRDCDLRGRGCDCGRDRRSKHPVWCARQRKYRKP